MIKQDLKEHWQRIYGSKADDEVGWFESSPELSLELITGLSQSPSTRIIDVGGGSSSLVDELLAKNFDVTVLDISKTALDRAKARLGDRAASVRWILSDVTQLQEVGTFDIWHDRATFHFLIDPPDRRSYTDLASRSLVSGGHLVIATFELSGPESCSGLPVERYDAQRLADELGEQFVLLNAIPKEHRTPRGIIQNFVYAVFRRN